MRQAAIGQVAMQAGAFSGDGEIIDRDPLSVGGKSVWLAAALSPSAAHSKPGQPRDGSAPARPIAASRSQREVLDDQQLMRRSSSGSIQAGARIPDWRAWTWSRGIATFDIIDETRRQQRPRHREFAGGIIARTGLRWNPASPRALAAAAGRRSSAPAARPVQSGPASPDNRLAAGRSAGASRHPSGRSTGSAAALPA